MSFVDDIGGESAVKDMLGVFQGRLKNDESIAGHLDAAQMTALTNQQSACLCAFIDGETDDASNAMADAHAYMLGNGLSDDGFDAIYDHYHDSLAELGIPGGMVHLFLEAFEDLRAPATA